MGIDKKKPMELPPNIAGRELIYSGYDDHDKVDIRENAEFRSMQFDTIIMQSEMSLKDPYALTLDYIKTMSMALLFEPEVKSVLTLGVGGGSLPKFVWKYFPNVLQDLVERSDLVVELAYKYFYLPKDGNVHMHVTDDSSFMSQTKKQYDIIFLDIYQGNTLPALLEKPDYFEICKKLLTKDGVLVWNTWASDHNLIARKFIPKLCNSFDHNLLILPANKKASNIFFAFPSKMEHLSISQIIENAKILQTKTNQNYSQMLADLNFLQNLGFIFQSYY